MTLKLKISVTAIQQMFCIDKIISPTTTQSYTEEKPSNGLFVFNREVQTRDGETPEQCATRWSICVENCGGEGIEFELIEPRTTLTQQLIIEPSFEEMTARPAF